MPNRRAVQRLIASFTGEQGMPYAVMTAESNATTTTFAGASTDFSNKSQITIFDTDGVSDSAIPDHTNDHITIGKTSTYFMIASLSFSGGGSDTISFAFFKNNGATQLGVRMTRALGTGGDVGSAIVSAMVSLSASDTVELWAQNEDDTSAITVQDITVMLDEVT